MNAGNDDTPRAGAPVFDPSGLLNQMAGPWGAMAGMWNAWFEASKSLSQERGADIGKSFTRLFDPEFWKSGRIGPLLEELQGVLSLPRLADLPELELSTVQASAAMLDLFNLFQRYMAVSIPMWMAASNRFRAEMAERAGKNGGALSPGEALDVWNNVLDRALMEFNRSGEYAQIQQQLLHAAAHSRLEMRKMGERYGRLFDMPTRKEMTELYRRMHELQREVHTLRRELRAVRSDMPSESHDQHPSKNSA